MFGKQGGKMQGQQLRINDSSIVEPQPTNIAKQHCGKKNNLKQLARMRTYMSHSNQIHKEDMESHGRATPQSSKIGMNSS